MRKTQFDEANLNRATLENADLTNADFAQAYLYQTRLTGAQINDKTQFYAAGEVGDPSTANACRYDSGVAPDSPAMSVTEQAATDADPEEARARRARSTYSRLEDLATENGFPDLKSEMFIRRQDARRELLFAQNQRVKGAFAQIQKWLFRYGESFRRVATISGGIILLSWVWFLMSGVVATPQGKQVTLSAVRDDPPLIWETFYYSVSVFFAGQGTFSPTEIWGQLSILFVRASGPILLALLVFVLGRRAAR